jgi:hypothetical protein
MDLQEERRDVRSLVHDRDTKFPCGGQKLRSPCDLRLRPSWPPVGSVRIAFLEGPSQALPPTGVDEI